MVEGYATYAGRTFQVLGVDPFAEAPFRPYLGGEEGGDIDLSLFMAKKATVFLARPTSENLGKAPGDTLTLTIGGVGRPVEVAGLLEPGDERSAEAMSTLLLADVATAQELFEMTGRLSRIDLIIPQGAAGEKVLADVRAVLPEGADVVRSRSRTETVESMTRAFELNLTALSLLALLVGMFLIYNTMTFSVVQRRPLIGRLRALGVTRREVFGLVLGEALLIGVIGTAIGLLGGVVLGRGLVELVTQTINDLYYVLTVRRLSLSPLTLLKGGGPRVGRDGAGGAGSGARSRRPGGKRGPAALDVRVAAQKNTAEAGRDRRGAGPGGGGAARGAGRNPAQLRRAPFRADGLRLCRARRGVAFRPRRPAGDGTSCSG